MASDATFADVRICVLDDNRNFQNLLRTLLRGLGFRYVDVFADPFEARAFVAQTAVDLAFVDLMMPRQNGIDWVRAARRSSNLANPTMAIALVTGHAERRVLDASLHAGVDDVLVKPLSPATLHRHTQRLLRHPLTYVRGGDGYFGPNLREVHGSPRQLTPDRPRIVVDDAPIARRNARALPGLHVEIRRDTGYDVEQTFLD